MTTLTHTSSIIAMACVAFVGDLQGYQASREARRPPNALAELNDKAADARKNESRPVRAMIDDIFDRFAGFEIPVNSQLRDRVFNAEMDYRLNKHPAIMEGQLVRAVNQAADRLFAPAWAKTNLDQIHLLRVATHPLIPQLVGTESNGKMPYGISARMSPGEAVFLCLFLANGKMWDEQYRVPPEQWVAGIREDKAWRAEGGRGRGPQQAAKIRVGEPVPPEVIAFIDSVDVSFRSGEGVASREANAFLTSLGIRR